MNQLIRCILHSFFIHQKFFIQLLTRTKSCVFDLDIFSDFVSGQADQILRKIGNFDRLSHIKHKDLPAFCVSSGLQYKRYRFRNRHKVTYDIRMCNRNRSSGCNLLFEQRNHTSVASKYVSKSYRYEFCIIFIVHCLYDHLTDTFRRTHDTCRIHRFVCRNQNKPFHTIHSRCRSQIICTYYVVFNCFIRTALHKRHMLMRCCMVDYVWTVFFHNLIDTMRASDRGNQHN